MNALIKGRNGPRALVLALGLTVVGMMIAFAITDHFAATMRIAGIGLGFSIIIVYAKWAYVAFRKAPPPLSSVDYLALAVVFKWVGTIILSSWFLAVRMAEYPEWMVKSDWPGYFMGFIVAGGVLQLLAPSASEGRIAKRGTLRVGIATGAVMILFLVIAAADGWIGEVVHSAFFRWWMR